MAEHALIKNSPWKIFLIFLRLGLTSFGGPVAHLGYFREEFVVRRRWLGERDYADFVALCQFLPGPASSQVGMALGLTQGGYSGALAAWLGFTLPSAILLILFALGIANYGDFLSHGALHGLKVVAVAVVAQAVWGMARSLCTDAKRIFITVLATFVALLLPSPWTQVGIIFCAGVVGLLTFGSAPLDSIPALPQQSNALHRSRIVGTILLIIFFILMITLPLIAQWFPLHTIAVVDAFYRAGALVFGGGHVVLPLLETEVVPSGWVNEDIFLAGYGAAQAVPGPLFTFAAFLGASMPGFSSSWVGGLVALGAIFLPAFLLITGALPFWNVWRCNRHVQAGLAGVNAAVVGLLVAAFVDPVWSSAIYSLQDFALALTALLAVMFWKLPPWLVVIGCGFAGWFI